MAIRFAVCVAGTALVCIVGGCSSRFEPAHDRPRAFERSRPDKTETPSRSVFREEGSEPNAATITLSADASPDDYVRYALHHSPAVEAAY